MDSLCGQCIGKPHRSAVLEINASRFAKVGETWSRPEEKTEQFSPS